MKVRAVASFVGRVGSGTLTVARGMEFDLPVGVDWLRAGLVVAIEPPQLAGSEHAVVAAGSEQRGPGKRPRKAEADT